MFARHGKKASRIEILCVIQDEFFICVLEVEL